MRSSLAVAAVLAVGCGDSIERNIEVLIEGGEGAEKARLKLNMAKAAAVEPLRRALEDRSLPVRARVDFVEALYRLHLREEAAGIVPILLGVLADPEPQVRIAAARAIGDLRESESVAPLLERLDIETEADMQAEILKALELMCLQEERIELHLLSEDQVASLSERIAQIQAGPLSDSLRVETREWLEVIADHKAVQAHQLYLSADVAGAEALLQEALALVPGSMNIGQKLGRLYYETSERERGIDHLAGLGMVAVARPLSEPPVIDGRLDDAAWGHVEPLDEFYQCIHRLTAHRAVGRSEAWVGYFGQTLYFAVKGYEQDTSNLVAASTDRDARQIYMDDCVEIYLDTNHDGLTFYQFIVNSLGVVADDSDGPGGRGRAWSTQFDAATSVADTFWVAEVAVPVAGLDDSAFVPGDVWGFNIARVRIGSASEFGQWVPTYGYSHRPDRFGYLVFE